MNMGESSNLIELLWAVGFKGDEVSYFQLGVEGRISVEEAAKRINEMKEKRLRAEDLERGIVK